MQKKKFEDCFEELPDGTTWVKVDRKWGCIDQTGEWIIRPAYDDVGCWDWDKGLIRVRVGAKFGYIDTAGQWIIEPIFDDLTWFYEGIALALVNRKWGILDMTGKWISEPKCDFIEIINARCIRLEIAGKYIYIDFAGNELVDHII